MATIFLLIFSNVFMTTAWYGHLKYKAAPLILVILVSWLIALPEYCLAVPANRLGSAKFSLTQLKIMQEAITLIVFLVFARLVFKEPIKWNTIVAVFFLLGAVYKNRSKCPAACGGDG